MTFEAVTFHKSHVTLVSEVRANNQQPARFLPGLIDKKRGLGDEE